MSSLGEWTYGEICQLRKMTAEGKGNDEIAEALGRSVIAVKEKKRQLKIRIPKQHKPKNSSKPWTEEDIAELERLFHQGKNDKEIGEILGRTWPAIRSKRYTLGLYVENAGKKIDYSENADNILRDVRRETEKRLLETLKEGDAYMLGYGTKGMNWGRGKYLYERPMVYKGALKNATGKMLFMFTSSTGGWTETFTAEQLKDMEIERVDHA